MTVIWLAAQLVASRSTVIHRVTELVCLLISEALLPVEEDLLVMHEF